MTQDITSLIEKLEGASEGSVELSCDIGIALGEWTPPKGAERDIYSPDIWRRNGLKYYQPYAEVTTSLDAALALAERVLPGTSPGVSKNVFHGYWSAWLHQNVDGACHVVGDASTSTTPALALCAAVLRAQSEAR